jgi:hypothetical protein
MSRQNEEMDIENNLLLIEMSFDLGIQGYTDGKK